MKTKLLVATALVVAQFTPVAIAPAFAQTIDPAVQAQLDAFCATVVPPGGDPDNPPPLVITAISVEVISSTTGSVTVTFNTGSEHRHGGSPNIFGTFHVVSVASQTTYGFDCQTYNSASGTYPPGLQREGQVTTITTGTTATYDADGVICNSPGRNPGTWRNQNGYPGNCQTLATTTPGFYNLPLDPAPPPIGNPIPSNSLP
jgi:hypothetical protein